MALSRKVTRYAVIATIPFCLILYYNQFFFLRSNLLSLPYFVEHFQPALTTATTTRHASAAVPAWIVSTQPWATPHYNALYRNHIIPNDHQWKSMEELLTASAAIPFYIYPSETLSSASRFYLETLFDHNLSHNPEVEPAEYRVDVRFEIDIFRMLWNHSLRVFRPDDAQLIFLPVSFASIRYDAGLNLSEKAMMFDEIWENLKVQPPFAQGKPHVIVSMTFELFGNWQGRWWRKERKRMGLRRFFDNVKNVSSVARGDDLLATNYIYRHNVTSDGTGNFRGFEILFQKERPVTEFTFSVGMSGLAKHIPLRRPTMEAFQNSTYFIFYRTRRESSVCGSTEYRHAPLVNVSWSSMPLSSVGHPIPPDKWAHDFSHSKFCLVIRGDNPASHSLFSSIKAGCIPVVISDWFLFHAPPLPTTLDMRDFSIVIPEEVFIQNPQLALESLQHVPDAVIESKLKALAWAQRVALLDYPNTLFVPAFLREAKASFSRPASELLRSDE